MSKIHFSFTKLCGVVAAIVFALLAKTLDALPSSVYSNDVYPVSTMSTLEPEFSAALARNMSAVTDLKEFIMKYVEDPRICTSDSFYQLIVGDGDSSDQSGAIWWSKRCRGGRSGGGGSYKPGRPRLPESTLIRYRRKSANSDRSKSQRIQSINPADKKKLQKLMKNKKVHCNPKKAVVELPNSDSSVVLKPSCVYIKQCSGCCDTELLECIPTQFKKRKFKVMALSKTNSRGKKNFGSGEALVTIAVQEHKKCQCQCRQRREHCSPNQIYIDDACKCSCPSDSNKTCPPGKIWNDTLCECVCSNPSECTTGRYFDTETCRCADPPLYKVAFNS